jgi:hypothetical protein
VPDLRAWITGPMPCERQVRDRVFAFYDSHALMRRMTARMITTGNSPVGSKAERIRGLAARYAVLRPLYRDGALLGSGG